MSDNQTQPEWYAQGLRFTCTQCGNCCSGPEGYVWVNEAEQQSIADRLGISRTEFRMKYARREFGRWTLRENHTPAGYDCIFLARDEAGRGTCSIYEDRPTQCRTWPFWPELLRTEGAWKRAAERCPGMAAGTGGVGNFYPIEEIRIQRDANKS